MRVLVLGGPTASGKTAAAIAAAEAWGATILSADAMQVYQGMDIGTAKVTPEERARVRHEGVDLVAPDAHFDVRSFLDLADRLVEEGAPLVVAGGTSLYLKALVRGLVETPPVDPALRAELEAADDLHARLAAGDPELARRLHPRDRVRLIRGIEVWEQSGERLSELQAAHKERPDRVEAVGLFLDRDDLDARIDGRVEAMMAGGYVDEVRGLLAAGYDRALKPMRSLGYRHLCDHLLDGTTLEEATRLTSRDTRRFARKQRTWRNALGWPRILADHERVALAAARRAFAGSSGG